MPATPVTAEFPEKLQMLFQDYMPDGNPVRYKVAYGGRGGAKSVSFSKALLLQGVQQPLRVLCAREFMNSMKDSVHKDLCDRIKEMDMYSFYEIQQSTIKGANGTEFSFEGIKNNPSKIKSYAGVDRCWVEEASLVSKASWDVLDPTIRKERSQIWISFNPEFEGDYTYKFFVKNTPPDTLIAKINYYDNPWFPEVLRRLMEACKERSLDDYLHIWEGNCRVVLDGAVYGQEMRAALNENRITRVPYDHTKPVDTFWDLGFADMTAIWFAQAVGMEYHIIDYLEDRFKSLEHYVRMMQKKGYVYGTDWLPWDGRAKSLGTGRSIEELLRAAGRKVRVIPRLSITDGINACRTIFPQCYFDETRCTDGLQSLRNYKYELIDGSSEFSRTPLHDQYSHGADAFRSLGVALKQPKHRDGRLLEHAKKLLGVSDGYTSPGQASLGWMR